MEVRINIGNCLMSSPGVDSIYGEPEIRILKSDNFQHMGGDIYFAFREAGTPVRESKISSVQDSIRFVVSCYKELEFQDIQNIVYKIKAQNIVFDTHIYIYCENDLDSVRLYHVFYHEGEVRSECFISTETPSDSHRGSSFAARMHEQWGDFALHQQAMIDSAARGVWQDGESDGPWLGGEA